MKTGVDYRRGNIHKLGIFVSKLVGHSDFFVSTRSIEIGRKTIYVTIFVDSNVAQCLMWHFVADICYWISLKLIGYLVCRPMGTTGCGFLLDRQLKMNKVATGSLGKSFWLHKTSKNVA